MHALLALCSTVRTHVADILVPGPAELGLCCPLTAPAASQAVHWEHNH